KNNFVLLSNTKDVIKLKTTVRKPVALTATLIGNPAFDSSGSISSLPGTKFEIENIKIQLTAKGYKVTTYVQTEASEQNIRKIKSPKILHFATHGFFIKEADSDNKTMGIESGRSALNPMLRSGLLVANAEAAIEGKSEYGILTAYEVMNLNLDQTEIVIMSACETGLGDVKNGEGVYGLQRAFLVAGADVLIMSLWKVNDEATQKLMTSFYKNYLVLNDKQKAFKAAQNELKILYKFPYYWGAFVLVQ
ncbi:MAG: CHAT domain-containing protein, partial [Cytophagales bacterium]|nr:CHAT domain-containing protein [Cytophaga sp.]